jgi:hypothetical protein
MMCSSSYAVSAGPTGAEISDLRIRVATLSYGPSVFGETRHKGQLLPMKKGTPANLCRNRWLILIFNMSRRRISVLGDVSEESTFCCVGAASILSFALTLFLYSPRGPRTRTMRT